LGIFLVALEFKILVLGIFMSILYILGPFGVICGHLVYFFPFWYVVPRNIWQPRFQIDKNVLQCWGLGECQDERLLKIWCNKTKQQSGNSSNPADQSNEASLDLNLN
jgi:hypothetical protein